MFQDFQERKRIAGILKILKRKGVIWDTSETHRFRIFSILPNQKNLVSEGGKKFETGPGVVIKIEEHFLFISGSILFPGLNKSKVVGPIFPIAKLEKSTAHFVGQFTVFLKANDCIISFSKEPRVGGEVIPFPIERRGAKTIASTP